MTIRRLCPFSTVLLCLKLPGAASSRIGVDSEGELNVDELGDPDYVGLDKEEFAAPNISGNLSGSSGKGKNPTSTANVSEVHFRTTFNTTFNSTEFTVHAKVDHGLCCSCPMVIGHHDNREDCEAQCTDDGKTTCPFGEASFCVTVPCSDALAGARQCSRSSAPCLHCEQDSDRCLQHRPHWGERYTCANSGSWCTWSSWRTDMVECCPSSCKTHDADMFDTPCNPIPPPGERKGFSLKRAARMASFANAAYCGPTEDLLHWANGAANMSGVKVVNSSVTPISADGFGYHHRRFAFVARLPGLAEADPPVDGLPLAAPENDACREHVQFAFQVGRHESPDIARPRYGHMKELAGVSYTNATLDDFQRLFFCGGDGVDVPCGAPPVTCSTPPCGACPVNQPPFTGGGCVVAVRGSNNMANMISDALAFHTNMTDPFHRHRHHTHPCHDCTVEDGFHAVYHSLAKGMFGALSDLGCGQNNDVFVTGHSLGAAVATIAAVHLHQAGFNVKAAYMFESPRVGNGNWARWFEKELGDREIFRTSHRRDPVPDGFPTWLDFQHIGKEVFFTGTAQEPFYVCTNDYECEHFKPYPRLTSGDHCNMPVVPGGDFCFCEEYVQ